MLRPAKWIAYETGQTKFVPPPDRLYIESTNICNLSCIMCPTGRKEQVRKKGYMDFELFKSIVDEMAPHVKATTLHIWGEALLHPQIVEMIASGAHLTLFTTGRGSVVGSAISPVIKVCANPDTFRRMEGDMDVNAGRILDGNATLDEVGQEIVDKIIETAAGRPTRSEALGHQEFILTYKTFEPIGPSCLPVGTR